MRVTVSAAARATPAHVNECSDAEGLHDVVADRRRPAHDDDVGHAESWSAAIVSAGTDRAGCTSRIGAPSWPAT